MCILAEFAYPRILLSSYSSHCPSVVRQSFPHKPSFQLLTSGNFVRERHNVYYNSELNTNQYNLFDNFFPLGQTSSRRLHPSVLHLVQDKSANSQPPKALKINFSMFYVVHVLLRDQFLGTGSIKACLGR